MEDKNIQAVSLDDLTKLIADVVESKVKELKSAPVSKKDVAPKAQESTKSPLTGDERVLAFFKALVSGKETQVKDLSEGTGSEGGYLVPTEFYGKVIEKLKSMPTVRKYATVIPMGSDKLDVPTEGNDMTFYWPAENAAATAADVSWGNVQLQANLVVGLTKMSRQFLEDAKVSVLDYLARIFARGIAREEDSKFIGGTGSGQPEGIRQAGITQTAAQAGASLAYSDVVNLWFTLPEAYRAGAIFLTSDAGAKALTLVVDSNNRPIFVPEPDAQGVYRLFGRPLLINENIPSNLGAGADETELWFGNFSYYLIGDREELATEFSTEAGDAFTKHQGWLKIYKRVDGRVALDEAFAYLSGVK